MGRAAALMLAALALLGPASATRETPRQSLIDQAAHERSLVVYSATDRFELEELLAAFQRRHPWVRIDYRSLPAGEVDSRFRRETAAGSPVADLLISSAMDRQIKLVNDQFAQSYASPEARNLPDWAVWKNEAFAVTAEPIVIGYNKRLLPAALRPRSHDELAALLRRRRDVFAGRIGVYDPERSPTGLFYLNQDIRTDPDSWNLITAIGSAQPRQFTSSSRMMDRIASGDLILAYNLIGSYAAERAAADPNFGIIVPQDYVLVTSRVALIPQRARHPATARLFLDFLLSAEGQTLLARHHMMPVRDDVGDRLSAIAATSNVRVVRVGPALMAGLDSVNRRRFFARWRESIAIGAR